MQNMAGLVSLNTSNLSAYDIFKCPSYIIKSVVLEQDDSVTLTVMSDTGHKQLKLNKINLQRLLKNYNLSVDSIGSLFGKSVTFYLTDLNVRGTTYKNVVRVKYDINMLLAHN